MRHLFYLFCVLVVIVKIEAAIAPKGVTKKVPLKNVQEVTTVTVEPTETTTSVPTELVTTVSPQPVDITTLQPVPVELSYTFPFYSRSQWGARDPVTREILNITQVPYIVVHDSGEPPMIEVAGCFNLTQCSASMKNIQNQHMDVNGWWDIGYNFAIGGDGAVYEGRGWGILGAQVKYFNSVSMGICFIGSYSGKLAPTLAQITAFNDLVATGIRIGYVRPDYRLINHGQIKGTLCPGKKLSKKVLTWPHYSIFPGSLKDLLDIPEIPENTKEEIRKELVSVSDAV